MRILLTGASGFVGRHLLESLSRRHAVDAPTSRELDVTDTSRVEEVVAAGRYDAVVHAAARGGERVAEDLLRGFYNLARLEGRYGLLVTFGSGAEYGKQRDLVKVSEEEIGSVVPADGYGFGKLVCTEICRSRRRMVNLRLFGAYGLHEGTLRRFISNTIAKALLGLPIVVRQDVLFDYLWADDLSEVVDRVLERGAPAPDLNVTPDASISLREIVALVGRCAGRALDPVFEVPGLNYEYTGSNARLRAAFPDLAFTPYEEGIARLYRHLSERREALDAEALAKDDYRARCRTRPASPAGAGEGRR